MSAKHLIRCSIHGVQPIDNGECAACERASNEADFTGFGKYSDAGICVLVDGGCLNQNRPVSERHMYGSIKVYYNGKPVKSTWAQFTAEQHRLEMGLTEDGNGNNQIAELLMAEAALTYATKLRDRAQGGDNPLTAITILQDSEYGLGWGSGSYKGNTKTSAFVLTEAQQCASHRRYLKEKGVKIEFQWVPEAWVKTQLGH